MSFPDRFSWGVATASYQIEGAAFEGGRGQSVWDMMCRKPGAVKEGATGDVACDHYHRFRDDIALMKELGVNAYRFSLAWPRILPSGECDVKAEGIAFYDRLIDALLEAGITPWATLYHWDMPLDLYRKGGWLNPDSPKWFGDYAQVVTRAFGDRVAHWMTQNEPQVFIGLGLWEGVHAPGDKLRWAEVLQATHNSLLGHGYATQAIRAHAKKTPRIGIAPACNVGIPATDDPKDIEAARQATFWVKEKSTWQLSWWLDPIFLGQYPADGLELYKDELPEMGPDDLKIISQPLDFFGMNVYHGLYYKAGEMGPEALPWPQGSPITAFKWPLTPECLYWAPKFYSERYGNLPVAITENGLSGADWVMLDGKVHDGHRIDFTHRHLAQFRKAAADGVPVEGYFHWTLMDNFEWAEGYRERFGLVHVDFETQVRTPKDSFYWYRDVIAQNGSNL